MLAGNNFVVNASNNFISVMNRPFLKQTLPMAALAVILFVLLILPHIDSMFFANSRYSECADLVKSNPARALELAKSWRKESPDSLLGKHCEAVAMFAAKDYAHAAEDFMELAKHVTTANPLLSGRLFRQAAEAYTAAGKPDQAREALTAAMLVNSDMRQLPAQNNDKAMKNKEIHSQPPLPGQPK